MRCAGFRAITYQTTAMFIKCIHVQFTFDERVQKIKAIHRGWINNFRLTNIQEKLKELDGWLRNRLRYCIWHHWNRRS